MSDTAIWLSLFGVVGVGSLILGILILWIANKIRRKNGSND